MLYSHLFSFFFRRVLLVCARERVIHSVEIGQIMAILGEKVCAENNKVGQTLVNFDKC